jgi:hypothetical protein
LFEGLRDASVHLQASNEHLVAASREMVNAFGALQRVTAAALHARDEQEDLRESVRRLEALVQELLNRDGRH